MEGINKMQKFTPAGIGIDIDGCLIEVEREVEKEVNALFGTEYSEGFPLFTDYCIWNCDVEEEIKMYVDARLDGPKGVSALYNIEEDMVREIRTLAMLRPVYIITGRHDSFPGTVKFFREKIPHVAGVVSSVWCSKWMEILGLDITVMVEDCLEEAEAITMNTGAYVILITKGYNVHTAAERIIPVTTMEEAIQMIYELWKKGVV